LSAAAAARYLGAFAAMPQKPHPASAPAGAGNPPPNAEHSAPPPRGGEDPSATTLTWTPPPGALGRPGYSIGRRLGAGGFAEVFAAELRRPPLPPQQVAIKRLLPGLRGDPAGKRQLRREAEIAARLTHDNIVRVHELLEIDDELVLVMELVDGLPGNQLLQRLARAGQALRLPAAAYLLRGLLSALDHLTRGAPVGSEPGAARPLVHADISLENLMVTTGGAVKLIDFGLAGEDRTQPRRAGAAEDQSLTGLRQVAGKRSYAPPPLPAQKTGAAGAPTAPTSQRDLYAAGVCAWELCTGRRFPLLPPGAGRRELASLIAFAADGLPAAAWRLLKLCLLADAAAPPHLAAEGLLLTEELHAGRVRAAAMGALVRTLVGGATAADEALAAPLLTPAALPGRLADRVRGAFCAHSVRTVRAAAPADPDAASAPASPPAVDDELCFPLDRAGAPGPSYVLAIDPGPGRAYDPVARALLRNLLGAPGSGFAKPADSG
jgi:serine/threonine-protein kinase